jgi:uncharacterized protein YerC
MFVNDAPPAAVQILADLSSSKARCQVVRRISDDEKGDRIEARCGTSVLFLGNALKGVTTDRTSPCSVIITLNAVNFPQLLKVDNCQGPVRSIDLGRSWVAKLASYHHISSDNLEYASYEKISDRTGCYKVTITFDKIAGAPNTPYGNKSKTYCVTMGGK